MSNGRNGLGVEQHRKVQYAVTLQLSFEYAGGTHHAITTAVSPMGATVVTDVRLPPGAILIFDVKDGDAAPSGSVGNVRLIAQVVWSGPAPFGGPESFAAELELLRATGGSWDELIRFFRDEPQAMPHDGACDRGGPSVTVHKKTSGQQRRAEKFEVLFSYEGVWFRGEIVMANVETLWIRTSRTPPRPQTKIRVRVAVRDHGKLAAMDVRGCIPTQPLPDAHSRGWVFELAIDEISDPDRYGRLVTRLETAVTGQ